jgi:hypothetical protein
MFHNVMPWHEHGAGYYFRNFVTLKFFTPWIFVLATACIYTLFFLKDQNIRKQVFQWMILGFGYLLVITFPAVKLEWYDAPVYPFFALILGVVAGSFCIAIPVKWKWMLMVPVVLLLWLKIHFIEKDIAPRHPFEYEGAMLRHASVDTTTKVFMRVETPEHQLHLDFYRKVVERKTGNLVKVIDDRQDLRVGDHIIISQPDQMRFFSDQFQIDTFKVWPGLGYEIRLLERTTPLELN